MLALASASLRGIRPGLAGTTWSCRKIAGDPVRQLLHNRRGNDRSSASRRTVLKSFFFALARASYIGMSSRGPAVTGTGERGGPI